MAPLDWVEEATQALQASPELASKIMLGLNFYGFDFVSMSFYYILTLIIMYAPLLILFYIFIIVLNVWFMDYKLIFT